MFCDNCGNTVDDDTAFCSKCGQSLAPEKVPGGVPPPRRSYKRAQTSDNLCFGEENKNPYGRGIFFIFVAIFFAVIFFFPTIDVEVLVVLGFLLIGISAIIQARRGNT